MLQTFYALKLDQKPINIIIEARGQARVITRLEDAKTIKPGDILVTTSTDIGINILNYQMKHDITKRCS